MTKAPKRVRLKRFLRKRRGGLSLLEDFAALTPGLCLEDNQGQLLLGEVPAVAVEKHAIMLDGSIHGWVYGHPQSPLIAMLLSHLVNNQGEYEALSDEALDRYREINLLYNLAENLAASLDVAMVGTIALREASRVLKASSGALMLLRGQQLHTVASFGEYPCIVNIVALGQGIIGNVAQSGKAEVVSAISSHDHYHPAYWRHKPTNSVSHCAAEHDTSTLICAPLKASQGTLGVIFLANDALQSYSAGDLKLLNTVAAQTVPAIESALLYERTLQEAKQREQQLEQQIQALRIELDEAKVNRQVAEITETDYFKQLRTQAQVLRKIVEGDE